MKKILIIFGSKSDSAVYRPIAEQCKKLDVYFELHVASAHRTPDYVAKLLSKKWDLVVSGAGLAAHLPGVVAAKQTCPVIGVPTIGAFEGLDSFLAIVQMPPGIPVLGVSPGNFNAVNKAVNWMLNPKKELKLIGKLDGKAPNSAKKTLTKLNIAFSENSGDGLAINFTSLDAPPDDSDNVINCPISDSTSMEDSIKFLKVASNGVWVGVNRGENAALAAAEVLGLQDAITAHREGMAVKVLESDREEQKWLQQK